MARLGVPPYHTNITAGKQHPYLVGIPVINEGERIQQQLQQMGKLSLPADIVLADGGSTDGSLTAAAIQAAGARGVLTKQGQGGLSTQLRMLFDWAAQEGYEGVVTIDGNGKDDVQGLLPVLHALQQGYDFVQGSRYVPGGAAINTPWDRHIAVKLLHAPLISLAARTKYTDTTNGLRGWKMSALLDPRVDVFRDVFDQYNLHYYLSIRLPRLGYQVCEVPVVRRYPDAGPTPSKISSPRKKIQLLLPLWQAVRGAYNP